MLVLGIESTCDETAASVVKDGCEILSNVIFSQTDLHKKYGAVAFRFSDRRWKEFPLMADKFAKWINRVNGNGNVVNLFMDFETAM